MLIKHECLASISTIKYAKPAKRTVTMNYTFVITTSAIFTAERIEIFKDVWPSSPRPKHNRRICEPGRRYAPTGLVNDHFLLMPIVQCLLKWRYHAL